MARFRLGPLFVLMLAFALIASSGAAIAAQTPAAGDDSLTVMTYNIHHGAGNDDCTDPETEEGEIPDAECALDLERIASVIEAEAPDIVALQEVDRLWARSGGVDQPQELADMLGMDVCYGANLDHSADDHADEPHQYGVAILSVYPIESCENSFLPIVEGEEQRGLLDARITTVGAGEVAVLNTHFDHKEPSTREMQADAVVDYMQGMDLPVVLMGDLNAAPDDGDLAPIQGVLNDAWLEGGDGSDGMTYPASPVDPLEKRIDYVFVSPSVAVLDAHIVTTDEAFMAADHLPVVVDVSIDEGTTPSASPVVN